MLCILKGSYRFFTALVDELTIERGQCSHPLVVDFIRVKVGLFPFQNGDVSL